MLKIAVCDDEKDAVEKIKQSILRYRERCEIDSFFSGEELLKSRKKSPWNFGKNFMNS